MKAAHYIFGRMASGALLLVAVSILSFSLSSLVPGDHLDEMRLNPQVSAQTLVQLRSQFGLDRPLHERYFHWLRSVVRGELGYSFGYNMPVASLIWSRSCNTMLLAAIATLIIWMVAVPLGVLAATRGGWLDHVISSCSSFLLSVPELAMILVLLSLAVRTQAVPIGGMTASAEALNRWSRLQDIGLHLVVPTLALVLVGLPVVFHHTRAAMKPVLEAPFIKAARGHGIGSLRIVLRHALPAAANPLISLLGLSIAGLIGSSLLAELVTGWPGLGPLFLQSIFARDFDVVIAIAMLSSSFLIVGNLLGDLLLCAADPRIRAV